MTSVYSLGGHEIDIESGLQRDIGLFPARPASPDLLEYLVLSLHRGNPHGIHLNLEHQFHGLFDLWFVGVARYLEHELPMLLPNLRALLGDPRLPPNLHQAFLVHDSHSSIFSTAALVPRTFS